MLRVGGLQECMDECDVPGAQPIALTNRTRAIGIGNRITDEQ